MLCSWKSRNLAHCMEAVPELPRNSSRLNKSAQQGAENRHLDLGGEGSRSLRDSTQRWVLGFWEWQQGLRNSLVWMRIGVGVGGKLLDRGWGHQDSALGKPNILGGKLSSILQAKSALALHPFPWKLRTEATQGNQKSTGFNVTATEQDVER